MAITTRLRSNARTIKREYDRAVDRAINVTLSEGLAEARRRVPVRTGALHDSIVVSFDAQSNSGVVGVRSGPTEAYAPIVEERQPYMRPALDLMRRKLLPNIRAEVRKVRVLQ